MSKQYNLCDVFCALRDQLASLGRHAQLTLSFSAVAELLVKLACIMQKTTKCCPKSDIHVYYLMVAVYVA